MIWYWYKFNDNVISRVILPFETAPIQVFIAWRRKIELHMNQDQQDIKFFQWKEQSTVSLNRFEVNLFNFTTRMQLSKLWIMNKMNLRCKWIKFMYSIYNRKKCKKNYDMILITPPRWFSLDVSSYRVKQVNHPTLCTDIEIYRFKIDRLYMNIGWNKAWIRYMYLFLTRISGCIEKSES